MKGMDLKNKTFEINLIDGPHKVTFDMNTLCELEDIYGDINLAMESFKSKPIKALRSFVYAFLKVEEFNISLAEAGARIPMAGMEQIVKQIAEALTDAMPSEETEPEAKEIDETPEAPAEVPAETPAEAPAETPEEPASEEPNPNL